MKIRILSLLLCAVAATAGFGWKADGSQTATAVRVDVSESEAARRIKSFEIVWRTVKEKHFDPTLGGLDWDGVRKRYLPKAEAAKTDSELYDILQQMLGELGESHFGIIPPEAIVDRESGDSSGQTGADIRIIDGQAVISRVGPGSAAEKAGLRPGFVIVKIEQENVPDLLRRIDADRHLKTVKLLVAARAVLGRLSGAPGSSVHLSYLDGQDRLQEAMVEREKNRGEMIAGFGNLPGQYAEFEARRLKGGIGYIRFDIFLMPLLEKIRAAVRSMKDAPGIIIDVRGNPGGIGGMSFGIAGILETSQVSLGTMKMRSGHINFLAYPQPGAYTGPVVILADTLSASTSEILAAGLQELGRAAIIGERTAGAALPSIIEKLPTGALFQYAIADFKTPRGVLLEGRGVTPDMEVKLNRRELLTGHDSQLEAALLYIEKSGKSRSQ